MELSSAQSCKILSILFIKMNDLWHYLLRGKMGKYAKKTEIRFFPVIYTIVTFKQSPICTYLVHAFLKTSFLPLSEFSDQDSQYQRLLIVRWALHLLFYIFSASTISNKIKVHFITSNVLLQLIKTIKQLNSY